MKRHQTTFFIALASSLLGGVAFADSLTNLESLVQRNRAVISNNASIDEANAETVNFTTNLDSQLVELNLNASRLNDAFISAINYPEDPATRRKPKSSGWGLFSFLKGRDDSPTQITFGSLKVVLDGCDITGALIAQCNSAAPNNGTCWSDNTARTAFTGVFGTQLFLNLSALNPQTISGCSVSGSSFFALSSPSHQIQFSESVTGQGKGGSLNYQVIVFQKSY